MLAQAGGLETVLPPIGEDQQKDRPKAASLFAICDLDHAASVAARENVWFAVQPNAVH
jgi:hypothetical protein